MKIALCLFGQVRDLQRGYSNYVDNILSKYDVDVFAHLWEDLEIDTFYNLYNPVSSKIERQVQFDTNKYTQAYGLDPGFGTVAYQRTFNSISQFYSFDQVCKLRQEYEHIHRINYDVCIKGRLDTWIIQYNVDMLNLRNDTYYVPSMPQGYIYNDVLAIGSTNVMDIVASRFSRLQEWYESQDYNFIPEYVTDKILKEYNINITKHPELACDLCRVSN